MSHESSLIAIALSSPFVDDAAFLEAVGVARSDRQAVQRYLDLPPERRGTVSPFFDTDFYCRQIGNFDLAKVDPLAHFVMAGVRVPISPHPLIDLQFLRTHGRDVFQTGGTIADLCRVLLDDLAVPTPYFDPEYYRQQVQEGQGLTGLLGHFLRHGMAAGLRPNPLLDLGWYADHLPGSPGLARALAHFVVVGDREGRAASPSFDGKRYMQRHADVAAAKLPPLAHYLMMGRSEGRAIFPVADATESYTALLPPSDLQHAAEALTDSEVFTAAHTIWMAFGRASWDRLEQIRAEAVIAKDDDRAIRINQIEHALRLLRLGVAGELTDPRLIQQLAQCGYIAA
jgi:hypothetical protein